MHEILCCEEQIYKAHFIQRQVFLLHTIQIIHEMMIGHVEETHTNYKRLCS